MCMKITPQFHTVTFADMKEFGITIDHNGINIPINPYTSVFSRKMSESIKAASRELTQTGVEAMLPGMQEQK